MEQIIYLDPDDEITTVRERLERAQTNQVSLVVPAGSRIFRNLVNLKLLQRYAGQMALDVILITGDGTTRTLARSLDIPLRSSLGAGRGDAERGGRERRVGAVEGWRGASAPPPPRSSALLQRLLGYLLLIAVVIALAGGVLLLLPTATITLIPATETISQTLSVKASPDFKTVDVTKGQIPARVVQATVEDVAQLESTGRKQEPAEKATGKVIFRNLSGDTIKIPTGTVVRTTTGTPVRFRTTTESSAEAGTFTPVPIAAELLGSGGNVPAWAIHQIEGSLSFQLVVANDTPTTGGAEKQMQLVTAADRQLLRDTLLDKLKAAVAESLKKDLKPGDFLVAAALTLRIEDEAFDREVGDISKTVGLRLRLAASSLVVPGDGLNKLAEGALQAKVSGQSSLVAGSFKLTAPSDVTVEGTSVSLRLQAAASTIVRLDEAQIRRELQGVPLSQARQLLAQKYRLAAEPQITLENAWLLDRLPFFGFQIQIKTASK